MLRKCDEIIINAWATCGSTSLGFGFISRRRFCVPKIAPTCFADDFDVHMACHLISFLFDWRSRSESVLACFGISYAAGKYLVDHKRSLESGESSAIGFVYWEWCYMRQCVSNITFRVKSTCFLIYPMLPDDLMLLCPSNQSNFVRYVSVYFDMN